MCPFRKKLLSYLLMVSNGSKFHYQLVHFFEYNQLRRPHKYSILMILPFRRHGSIGWCGFHSNDIGQWPLSLLRNLFSRKIKLEEWQHLCLWLLASGKPFLNALGIFHIIEYCRNVTKPGPSGHFASFLLYF